MGNLSAKTVFLIGSDEKFCNEFKKSLQGRETYVLKGRGSINAKALEVVESNSPDVVILDLTSGGKEGVVLMQSIYKSPKNFSYIVIITKTKSDRIIDKLYKTGADCRFDISEEDFGAESILEFLEEIYGEVPHTEVQYA